MAGWTRTNKATIPMDWEMEVIDSPGDKTADEELDSANNSGTGTFTTTQNITEIPSEALYPTEPHYVHSEAVHHHDTHLVHGVPAEEAGHRGKVDTVHLGGDVDTATVADQVEPRPHTVTENPRLDRNTTTALGQGRLRPSTEYCALVPPTNTNIRVNSITNIDNMSLGTNNCSNKPENKEIVTNTIRFYFKTKDRLEREGWERKEELHPARGNRDGWHVQRDGNVLENVRMPRTTANRKKHKLSWGSTTARKVKGQPSIFKFFESKSKAQKSDKIEEVVAKNTSNGGKRKRDTVGETKTTGFNPKRSKLTNSNTSKLGKTTPQGNKISFPGTKSIKEFFSNVNPDMGTLWKGEISNLPAREIKE